MRAIQIKAAGGELNLVDAPAPVAGPRQVVLKTGACGVCYRDLVDRQGRYPFTRWPVVTGHEFAGEVIAVGPDVSEWKVGDRVASIHRPPCGSCAFCAAGQETQCAGSPVMYGVTVDGGYAEQILAWSASLTRVPDGLPLEQAAFLHCTAGVALRALRYHAKLRAGETVVITGASGGVGVHAIQVAKILGARVIAVTSNEAKASALRGFGADEVVVSPDLAFHKQVRDADVALELVGAPTFNSALRSLRTGGRAVIVGNVEGTHLDVNPGYLIFREISVTGSAGASRADLAEVLGWAASGKLKPIVAEKMTLEDAPAAQDRLLHKSVIGRIVLVP